MFKTLIYKKKHKLFLLILIPSFIIYNIKRIEYGLPSFLNTDEQTFQYSTLNYFRSIIEGSAYISGANPIYAPLINAILISKFILINEYFINSLSFYEIKSKIYFNKELFILYGRFASLLITSFSIFTLFLIFKKLKIKFLIYSVILIIFSTSLAVFDVAIVNGKNSYYLLIFLIQIYFFFKYLLKINNLNFKSYLIFAILASLAWGVNYWPAFISIYAVIVLHLKKFKTSKLQYIFFFIIIFFIFGPLINFLYADNPWEYIAPSENTEIFNLKLFLNQFFKDTVTSFKYIFSAEKNIFLLIIFTPFYLIYKNVKFKELFILSFFLIFEPIAIFAFSDKIFPQLRYFVGTFSLILILTSIIVNEMYKSRHKYSKYFITIFLFSNLFFIYDNVSKNVRINKVVSNNSFFEFIKDIKVEQKKVLYLVDLRFQESLSQNLLYMKVYENDVIKKSNLQKEFYKRIKDKIMKIEETKEIKLIYENFKKDITYFNYTFFEIKNLKLFFDLIKKDFDYVVIEEAKPFHLSDQKLQKKIRDYVKENFLLEYTQFDEEKIFLRSLRMAISYFSNTLNPFDRAENIESHGLEKIYGNHYSLYKLVE